MRDLITYDIKQNEKYKFAIKVIEMFIKENN